MSAEKDTYILDKRVKLKQVEGGFLTGLDAVMLAAACPAQAGSQILDLGCGVGGAGLAVLARVADTTLTGIDMQQDHIDYAMDNAQANGFAGRADFVCQDIRTFEERRFDHVICNPPYMEAGAYIRSPSSKKDKALGQGKGAVIEDWVKCAFGCLRGRGSLTMIHRADQADRVIQAFGKRFGGMRIIPLWPKAGVEAKRVIISGTKHSKSVAQMHPGLILHEENGDYTAQAEAVLKEAQPIV